MLNKCINTEILARVLAAHPAINVHCHALEANKNAPLRQKLSFLGLAAPLFTIDMEEMPREAFARFFDSLEPLFAHMISLGQANTIVSCPALTTHSELDAQALAESGITPTTIRFAVGNEDPKDLLRHFIAAARLAIDPLMPGFSDRFPPPAEIDTLIRDVYLNAHRRYIESRPPMAAP
jgi:O-acetylhomoserine/O-acetylserine sulfhydrylase-like pyridoxal-dependent enzyme